MSEDERTQGSTLLPGTKPGSRQSAEFSYDSLTHPPQSDSAVSPLTSAVSRVEPAFVSMEYASCDL